MEEEEKKSKMANEKNTFVRGRLCDREGEGWGPTVLKGRRRSREGGWGDGRSHEGEKEGEGEDRGSLVSEGRGKVARWGRGRGKVLQEGEGRSCEGEGEGEGKSEKQNEEREMKSLLRGRKRKKVSIDDVGSQFPQFSTQIGLDEIIIDEIGGSSAKKKPRVAFAVEEDTHLISSWLNISTDPIVGIGQGKEAFWLRVTEN
ncbi:hypothetical protein JHK87_015869 [Glycine soja]|nr:hypothetical protein JHK87_015869 [Glycine soja]